jgi:UDP-hydrolysing UDP-N-acetyl-D-glucosamine 2-epimerase
MGGEVSGNIDESIRHAVTKFAHLHFPACTDAAERIERLGEEPDRIHVVGCPRMDLVAEELHNGDGVAHVLDDGVGGQFALDKPFVLVSQHPVTSEYGDGEAQITETLLAVEEVGLPAIVLWPNADAGSDDVARGIRKWRESHGDTAMHFIKNLPTVDYIRLMARTACLIGNSSSAIREGAFIGTPAVNVGSRQTGRQRGANIVDAGYARAEIAAAIRGRIEHGRYPSEPIYGDGTAGRQIADVLAACEFRLDKRITY